MQQALLLRLSFYTCVALTFAGFGALLVGRAQPIPDGILQLHLADCAPPCWIGIIPGVTTIADAKAKIVAAYSNGGLRIKDTASFPGGSASATAVDNEIEGENFYLFVRLTTSEPVDGRSETVQSITLLAARADRSRYAPTVADILGTFGAPQGLVVDEALSRWREITLKYVGLDVVFDTAPDRSGFSENPRLFLHSGTSAPARVRPWRGLHSLTRRM